MKTRTIALALGIAALGLAAGCSSGSSASHSTTAASATAVAAPLMTSDPYGQQCEKLDSKGYCPFDDPTTDPNGQTCEPGKQDASGYCPGDSPGYVTRLQSDGYTLDGSCPIGNGKGQGIGQAWGDDGNGNGELLMETKSADFAATLAAAMTNLANAAGNGSAVTIAVSGNFVVLTGPASATSSLGQAGCGGS